jgi:hypothetical protein
VLYKAATSKFAAPATERNEPFPFFFALPEKKYPFLFADLKIKTNFEACLLPLVRRQISFKVNLDTNNMNLRQFFPDFLTKKFPIFLPENLEVSCVLLEREREREREREITTL